MWRDLQFALRQLRRRKLFAVSVILLLAIGIGANTLIFSFVNALLLKPLPVRSPKTLFLLQKNRSKQVRPDPAFFYRQYEEVVNEKQYVSAAVAEQDWSDLSFQPFSGGDSVRLVSTQMVSPNYFSELGVTAVVGRALVAEDAASTSENPVVLSYQFWQSQFHGRRDVIGRSIRIKNYPFLVVGVLPTEFHDLDIDRAPDVRLPISASRVLLGYAVTQPGGHPPLRFEILVRIASGASTGSAAGAIMSRLQSH